MDRRDIAYFKAIVENGTLTKAAEKLFITQPTLTKYLQKLEESIGSPLFEKDKSRYVLTVIGEIYYQKLLEIEKILDTLDREIAYLQNRYKTVLRVGYSFIRGSEVILNVIPHFSALYPDVGLKFVEVTYRNFEQELLDSNVDVVFFNLPFSNRNLTYKPISKEEIILVCDRDHPFVAQAVPKKGFNHPWIPLQLVENEPVIMPSDNLRISHVIRSIFASEGVALHEMFNTSNVPAACILASEGHGLYFCGERFLMLPKFERQPAILSFGNQCYQREFAAIYRKDNEDNVDVQNLIKTTRHIYAAFENSN